MWHAAAAYLNTSINVFAFIIVFSLQIPLCPTSFLWNQKQCITQNIQDKEKWFVNILNLSQILAYTYKPKWRNRRRSMCVRSCAPPFQALWQTARATAAPTAVRLWCCGDPSKNRISTNNGWRRATHSLHPPLFHTCAFCFAIVTVSSCVALCVLICLRK